MKSMELLMEIPADLKGAEKDISSQQAVFNVLRSMLLSAYEKGLGEEQRRTYYKLCDDFERAIEGNASEVLLDDDRVKFIKSSISKSVFLPNDLTRKVEQLIDKMKDVEVVAKLSGGNGTATAQKLNQGRE